MGVCHWVLDAESVSCSSGKPLAAKDLIKLNFTKNTNSKALLVRSVTPIEFTLVLFRCLHLPGHIQSADAQFAHRGCQVSCGPFCLVLFSLSPCIAFTHQANRQRVFVGSH